MLRPAVTADVDRIVDLEAEVFGAGAWSTTAVQAELRHDVVVAEVGSTIAGYAAVRVVGDVADLTRIAVSPHCRREGIGASLVDSAVAAARSSGADRLLLEVAESNEGARALYTAAGFAEIARRARYYAGGVDALVLARDL